MYVIPEEDWYEVKREIYNRLIQVARSGQKVITYGGLCKELATIRLQPNSPQFHNLLGDISAEEVALGRGMLSCLVVKEADNKPGEGFYLLAKELGRDVSDKDKCWIEEVNAVISYWSTRN